MTVRLVSYNVRYFGHSTRGLASTRGAMVRIANAIASLDPLPDVICLQEVEMKSLRSRASHLGDEPQLTAFNHVLAGALADRGHRVEYTALYFPAHVYPIYTTGLAVLVSDRLHILDNNRDNPHDITHRASKTFARMKQTRICAHVRLREDTGEPFDVFNVHMSLPKILSRHFWNPETQMGFGENQLEEAKRLVTYVRSQCHPERAVLMGDFNSLPGSPVYQHVGHALSFRDAYAHTESFDLHNLRGRPTAGFMNFRMRIDHFFSAPGLRWTSFADTHPIDDKSSRFFGLSDHAPIVGTFEG